MFESTLARIVQTSGGRSAALVSLDGLTIDAVGRDSHAVSPEDANREYGNVLKQLAGAGDAMGVGALSEVTLEGEHETTLVRFVTSQYFVALRVPRDALVGRARFLLRVAAPDLAREL